MKGWSKKCIGKTIFFLILSTEMATCFDWKKKKMQIKQNTENEEMIINQHWVGKWAVT